MHNIMHNMAQHLASLGGFSGDSFLHGLHKAQEWGAAKPPNLTVPFCNHHGFLQKWVGFF